MSATKPPTLVVLQLTGGNDALNTVIPYADGLYYDNRKTVRIAEADVLKIDDRFGFHPSMAAIKPFWDDGKMAIIAGVGYPNPNYSHFRSMDIWYTAEPDKISTDGWLGKVVREIDPRAENVLSAVNFGRGLPRALALSGVPVASVAQLDGYGLLTSLSSVDQRNSALEVFSSMYDDGFNDDQQVKQLKPVHVDDPMNEVLQYMGHTGLDAQKGADILATALEKYSSTVTYPGSQIAANLKGIAQVKLADLGTRVFYTSHSSFDTHASELPMHALLWKEVSEAVSAFFADLRQHDAADDVILLMWSEFSRRVKDNGAGTDHGAGGVAFVLGDPVKGGMYGEYPSLKESDLTIGNLQANNDFRSTYGTILERWLQVEAKPIVNGSFEQFAFV
ncbi:MAG TPA: DUF1501 domain-containing protein [Dehalococcoidia bacterium]|nr:DUF1501 domain-containing protein [Dehalococcoidia bacterium]